LNCEPLVIFPSRFRSNLTVDRLLPLLSLIGLFIVIQSFGTGGHPVASISCLFPMLRTAPPLTIRSYAALHASSMDPVQPWCQK